MMLKWEKIKDKILSNTRTSFRNGNPSIEDEMIITGIELFKKLILHNTGIQSLNGFSRILLPALQDAFVDKIGEIGPLRIIADSLEPFTKILCIVGKGSTPSEAISLTLIPALKKLEINSALSTQVKISDFPVLSEANLESFRTSDQFLYQICSSYVIRNKVHEAPYLSDIDVLSYLRDLLVVYIFTSLKFKDEINSLPRPEINSLISDQVLNGDENKMLFDFISFGNTTVEIKSQIIDAFILHSLIDKIDEDINTLKSSTNTYLKKDLTPLFFQRKIENLRQAGKIEFSNLTKTSIKLSEIEKTRILKVQKDFNDNKELFLLYYMEIIETFHLTDHSDKILEKLTDFFVTNFNIDIKEIYEKDAEQTEDSILEDFLKYLHTISVDENSAKNLLKELLKLCEQSDFIVRISASRVIGKLTNPEYFENYIRKQKRVVYLDTQLILHALCVGYVNNNCYENHYYQIIEELLTYSKDHPNIELRFSRLYLSEVAYQLKLALLLVPFEDATISQLSTNIFYQFYHHLKDCNLLKEEDESFGMFLENWFVVTEDDALNIDCDQIISSNISDLLQTEMQIKVINFPFYETKDAASTLLEDTIKKNSLSPKSYHILANDALMVCHLSNSDEHETEPFLLTWDKTLTYFRKAFKGTFHKLDLISWHLFNPSKFLNHMSLIDFKIEPKSISNEYLPILESFGLHEKTRTIFDTMNRFLEIKNISKSQRHNYVMLTKKIFNEKEFSYEIDLPEEEIKSRISKPFETIIDEINSYYHSGSVKYNIDFYRKMLLNEDYFLKVTAIIKKEIIAEIRGEQRQDYKSSINLLLNEYEESIKIQHKIS